MPPISSKGFANISVCLPELGTDLVAACRHMLPHQNGKPATVGETGKEISRNESYPFSVKC